MRPRRRCKQNTSKRVRKSVFEDCVRDTPNNSLSFVVHCCYVVSKNVSYQSLPPTTAATTTSQTVPMPCCTSRPHPQQQQQLHCKLYQYCVIPAALICSSSDYITNCINIRPYQPLSSPATATSQTVSTLCYTSRSCLQQQQQLHHKLFP